MNYSERITELLFDSKISLENFAKDIGVSRSTAYRWKNSEVQFLLSNLIIVANYFECSTDFILCKTDNFTKVTVKELPPFYLQLRKVMKEKKISTHKLRKLSAYDNKSFKQWRNGSEPLATTLLELSNILDCSIDYLIGRE